MRRLFKASMLAAVIVLGVACKKEDGGAVTPDSTTGGISSKYFSEKDWTLVSGPKSSVPMPDMQVDAHMSFQFDGSSPSKPIDEVELIIETKPTGKRPPEDIVDVVISGATPKPISTTAYTNAADGIRRFEINLSRAHARQIGAVSSIVVSLNGMKLNISTKEMNVYGVMAKIPNVTP